MNWMKSMRSLKLFAALCALLMVFGAWIAAYSGAAIPALETLGLNEGNHLGQLMQIGRSGGIICAAAAIAFSWLGCKLEKPRRVLAISMGIGCALVLGIMGVMALILPMIGQVSLRQTLGGMLVSVLLRFVLILAMLLAIIWLVGNMIRRHLTERK